MWSSSPVKKCGWLMKQSGVMKTWSRRWFILLGDGRLTYFKSPADWCNPGVTIDLASCQAVQDRVAFGAKGLAVDWPSSVLRECCFVVSTQGKTLFLYAGHKDECSAWLVTLQHAMIKAAALAAENKGSPASQVDSGLDTLPRERFRSVSSIDSKIQKFRNRLSTVGRSTTVSISIEREDNGSDASDFDSVSTHSSHSGGNILEDSLDTRSMMSFQSNISGNTMQSMTSTMSSRPAASKENATSLGFHNGKTSYGLSKNRLPPQVAQDVQDSLPRLLQAIGSVNAVTGHTYTFLCNFGQVYKAVSWHLTGAGKQAAAEKERIGTIIHEKYLVPLGQCVVDLCEDGDQKQMFVQRTWKRLIEFQCRQSPFQEGGCHAADCWLDNGVLHVAVLAQYFGELPFQPLPLSIPEVNGVNPSASVVPSYDSGLASAGDYVSRSSSQSHDRASTCIDDTIPDVLKDDIANNVQGLHVGLQVIADATKVPFTFECDFLPLSKIVSSALHHRLARIVYNKYLMSISAAIVDYCEDESCRSELVRNVHSRRIVMMVDDEDQLVKDWGYLSPATPLPLDRLTSSSENLWLDDETDDGESSNQDREHGGQVTCRDGALYLTVPLQVFDKLHYEPSLDVFEARRPGDECSRLNNYVCSHASSDKLPESVRADIVQSAKLLGSAMDNVSAKLNFDLVLACNFDAVHSELCAVDGYDASTLPLAATIYGQYVATLCNRLASYVEEVTGRSSLLDRQVYNQKISFQLVSQSVLDRVMDCPHQHPLGEVATPTPRFNASEAESQATYTFLHRGIVRIVCMASYFGKGRYSVNIGSLPLLPDSIRLSS